MMKRFMLGVVLACLLLAGCSGGSDESEQAADPFAPLPTVEPAAVDVPEDRDPRAVEEALRRIDACALVEPALGEHPAFPASARVLRDGPHRCEVFATNGYHGELRALLGETMLADDRYAWRRIEVGGAAAYANADGGGFCQVAVPVSFEHVVMFTLDLAKFRGGWVDRSSSSRSNWSRNPSP